MEGIRAEAPGLGIGVRLSAFDFAPFRAGPDGVGVPEQEGRYRFAFGGDPSGTAPALAESDAFLDLLAELGVGMVCLTAGSPYYNPPPSSARPSSHPRTATRSPRTRWSASPRQLEVTAALARRHPALVVVGSGYSYLQQWLPQVAQAVLRAEGASAIGLGRMVLSYPELPADVPRRPTAPPQGDLPHLQRLHDRPPQWPGIGLLPHRRLLQAAPRGRDPARPQAQPLSLSAPRRAAGSSDGEAEEVVGAGPLELLGAADPPGDPQGEQAEGAPCPHVVVAIADHRRDRRCTERPRHQTQLRERASHRLRLVLCDRVERGAHHHAEALAQTEALEDRDREGAGLGGGYPNIR